MLHQKKYYTLNMQAPVKSAIHINRLFCIFSLFLFHMMKFTI